MSSVMDNAVKIKQGTAMYSRLIQRQEDDKTHEVKDFALETVKDFKQEKEQIQCLCIVIYLQSVISFSTASTKI